MSGGGLQRSKTDQKLTRTKMRQNWDQNEWATRSQCGIALFSRASAGDVKAHLLVTSHRGTLSLSVLVACLAFGSGFQM